MQRRRVLLWIGAALTAPVVARGEEKRPVVAIFDPRIANPLVVAQVRDGLASLGFHDGQNVLVEFHGAGGQYGELAALAAAVVREKPSVIIAVSVPSAHAAAKATASIPVVFMSGFDPVRQGLVASLNKPGRNLTGLSMLTVGLNAKRLQMLHELVPAARRIGLLVNPDNVGVTAQIGEAQEAASSLGCQLTILEARGAAELDGAFTGAVKAEIEALQVANDPFFAARQDQIVGLAARYRLPAIYEWDEFVRAGGLLGYGSSRADDYRTLGVYAGKILNGTRPADFPVAQPTKFNLAINLQTAKNLGLTVPPLLLARADEVIE